MTRFRMLPHLTFLVLLALAALLAWNINGEIFPSAGLPSAWFYTGLVMLLFSIFYVEPHYAAPKNVMTHSLAVILVLLSSRQDLLNYTAAIPWYRLLLGYGFTMLGLSWLASNLKEEGTSPMHWTARLSELLKDISVLLGEARIQYSCLFLFLLLLSHSITRPAVVAVLIFWWFVVVTNPQKAVAAAVVKFRQQRSEVAEIMGVQSRRIFLARAYKDAPVMAPLDPVEFTYTIGRDSSPIRRGVVLASHLLDDEEWIRVLELESGPREGPKRKSNAIYRIARPGEGPLLDITERFLGVVVERSEIGVIQFEVMSGGPSICEGDLVEVTVRELQVFYQIISARTGKEVLEAKNEGSFVRVQAQQLGCWEPEGGSFSKYGWLPEMYSPVLKARPEGGVLSPDHPECHLGIIPSTSVPFLIDLDTARTHHLALLGVTGSGKSFIALELIERMMRSAKVVCIDFTDEYLEKLSKLKPELLIKRDRLPEVEEKMARLADAAQKKGGREEALKYRRSVESKLGEYVEEFISGNTNLSVFELPELSNTSFVLEFTQMFLEAIFRYAKLHRGQRICIVIEEAHTVIPEANSLGDFGEFSANKALVNKIGQIALQGRKYGVGFMIIAQRTANVSKTVLTQCNSILCFQAFDETSYRFLESHLGSEMIKVLPRLKRYHAVAVGKAFRGDVPMIVDLTRPLPAFDRGSSARMDSSVVPAQVAEESPGASDQAGG